MTPDKAVSLVARAFLKRNRLMVKQLAPALGMNAGQLSRRLNGRTAWKLGEYALLCEVVGASPARVLDVARKLEKLQSERAANGND